MVICFRYIIIIEMNKNEYVIKLKEPESVSDVENEEELEFFVDAQLQMKKEIEVLKKAYEERFKLMRERFKETIIINKNK